MEGLASRFARAAGSATLIVVELAILLGSLILAGLLGVIPLSQPGGQELPTEFVNAPLIMPAAMGLAALGLVYWTRQIDQPPGMLLWPSLLRQVLWLDVGIIIVVWALGAVCWFNAYDVRTERPHDMAVVGYAWQSTRRTAPRIDHYELVELGGSWRIDLRPKAKWPSPLRVGDCARLMVRQGRLGLDWISEVQPIRCRA